MIVFLVFTEKISKLSTQLGLTHHSDHLKPALVHRSYLKEHASKLKKQHTDNNQLAFLGTNWCILIDSRDFWIWQVQISAFHQTFTIMRVINMVSRSCHPAHFWWQSSYLDHFLWNLDPAKYNFNWPFRNSWRDWGQIINQILKLTPKQ